jgi:Family of unknown function (DUF5995)
MCRGRITFTCLYRRYHHAHRLPAPRSFARASIRAGRTGTQPATPEDALAALDQVVAGLAAANDARAVFPNVYAVITEKVIERLSDGSGYFRAPEFITMLVGVFTTRYLQTLNWSLPRSPSRCDGSARHMAAPWSARCRTPRSSGLPPIS